MTRRWLDRLHSFEERLGVPQPLRRATRAALIGVAVTSLTGQALAIWMGAPAHAAQTKSQCHSACRAAYDGCAATANAAYQSCQKSVEAAFRSCKAGCHGLKGKDLDECNQDCEEIHGPAGKACETTQHSALGTCVATRNDCDEDCTNGGP